MDKGEAFVRQATRPSEVRVWLTPAIRTLAVCAVLGVCVPALVVCWMELQGSVRLLPSLVAIVLGGGLAAVYAYFAVARQSYVLLKKRLDETVEPS